MNLEINASILSTVTDFFAKYDVRTRPRLCRRALMRLAMSVLVLFVLDQAVYLQSKDDFDVGGVIRDVKRRFKLSARDLKSIRPLLNRENNNVIAIYARFSGDEPEYSDRVWQEIIAGHHEFLGQAHGDLTKRQWAALRAARSGMEERVVDYLVEDYIDFLGQFLELGKWEFIDLQTLFESDKSKKLRLFAAANTRDLSILQKQLETISADTESKLKKMLTEEQWRAYRSLTEWTVPTA